MGDEARLLRAMAAATPSARDEFFVIAVLERAEARRFRQRGVQALLRGAGYAAALAGLTAFGVALAPANAVMDGLFGAACLAAFVVGVRRATGAAVG